MFKPFRGYDSKQSPTGFRSSTARLLRCILVRMPDARDGPSDPTRIRQNEAIDRDQEPSGRRGGRASRPGQSAEVPRGEVRKQCAVLYESGLGRD